MKANHVNLVVNDVMKAWGFLEKYFGLTTRIDNGSAFALLNDENGMFLSLTEGKEVQYPEAFHIGFYQDNREKVNEINQRLKKMVLR